MTNKAHLPQHGLIQTLSIFTFSRSDFENTEAQVIYTHQSTLAFYFTGRRKWKGDLKKFSDLCPLYMGSDLNVWKYSYHKIICFIINRRLRSIFPIVLFYRVSEETNLLKIHIFKYLDNLPIGRQPTVSTKVRNKKVKLLVNPDIIWTNTIEGKYMILPPHSYGKQCFNNLWHIFIFLFICVLIIYYPHKWFLSNLAASSMQGTKCNFVQDLWYLGLPGPPLWCWGLPGLHLEILSGPFDAPCQGLNLC